MGPGSSKLAIALKKFRGEIRGKLLKLTPMRCHLYALSEKCGDRTAPTLQDSPRSHKNHTY
ncbi:MULTISPECIES: hypothetical protein [Kamptonema]|uniref:hypothetical protein n=1 Tax=Kamptonema TaxID=1501433 RepID=UPI0001DAD66B|nr:MULTISPECIES: hypothetical protein [Kamptonema]CBN57805.1 hypothetical protein OSCI_3520025 [Kamptonema sp. PCC 6506]